MIFSGLWFLLPLHLALTPSALKKHTICAKSRYKNHINSQKCSIFTDFFILFKGKASRKGIVFCLLFYAIGICVFYREQHLSVFEFSWNAKWVQDQPAYFFILINFINSTIGIVSAARTSATAYSVRFICSNPNRFESAGTKINAVVSARERIIVPQRSIL